MIFDRHRYLDRLGLATSDITADAAGLGLLQHAQMRAITFENIDPLLGRMPDLEPEALWQKLVMSGRGGYCMELNALFGMALESLGFSAQPLLARVRMGAASGGARTHHAFLVTIGGNEYLADTGFGGPAPAAPVRLDTEDDQVIGGVAFRMRRDTASGEEVLERQGPEGWLSLYGFDRAPTTPLDFVTANFICARWEKSPFPTTLMMTRLTETGRISLRNRDLRVVDGTDAEARTLGSEAELAEILRGPFQLTLDHGQIAAVWNKVAAA